MNRPAVIDYALAASAFLSWGGAFIVDWLNADGLSKAGHELTRAILFAAMIRLWYTTHSGGAKTVTESIPPPPPLP